MRVDRHVKVFFRRTCRTNQWSRKMLFERANGSMCSCHASEKKRRTTHTIDNVIPADERILALVVFEASSQPSTIADWENRYFRLVEQRRYLLTRPQATSSDDVLVVWPYIDVWYVYVDIVLPMQSHSSSDGDSWQRNGNDGELELLIESLIRQVTKSNELISFTEIVSVE